VTLDFALELLFAFGGVCFVWWVLGGTGNLIGSGRNAVFDSGGGDLVFAGGDVDGKLKVGEWGE
jgi:hypothetical protein